jgi:hypothetical protein
MAYPSLPQYLDRFIRPPDSDSELEGDNKPSLVFKLMIGEPEGVAARGTGQLI